MNPTIAAPQLNSAINRVLICTTKEVSRFRLDVVGFTSNGQQLKLEATDGHRLSVATIKMELPIFEILVSSEDCKAIKRICRRKGEIIMTSVIGNGLIFRNSKGEKVNVHPSGEVSEFPPLDHLLETETTAKLPVLDPAEFRRGVRLAQIARLDGEKNFKTAGFSNLIRLISTPRRMTVFGRSRQSRTRSVFHLDSDDRSSCVSFAVNANYLLDLLRVLPKDEPFEMGYWKNGTEGVVVREDGFTHVLCGITEKEENRSCLTPSIASSPTASSPSWKTTATPPGENPGRHPLLRRISLPSTGIRGSTMSFCPVKWHGGGVPTFPRSNRFGSSVGASSIRNSENPPS